MIDRRLALLRLFLAHALLASSVNATSIQGVAVSSLLPATTTTPSVQSILSGLPGSGTQAVTQSAGINAQPTSQSQDIAELKRRADESDQKIVRLNATTQDLKDT